MTITFNYNPQRKFWNCNVNKEEGNRDNILDKLVKKFEKC